jgi:hypothetical protein
MGGAFGDVAVTPSKHQGKSFYVKLEINVMKAGTLNETVNLYHKEITSGCN